jgi:hypothetical protein
MDVKNLREQLELMMEHIDGKALSGAFVVRHAYAILDLARSIQLQEASCWIALEGPAGLSSRP